VTIVDGGGDMYDLGVSWRLMSTQGKLPGRGGSIYQSKVDDKEISCMLACVLFKLSLVVILGFRCCRVGTTAVYFTHTRQGGGLVITVISF
jgi:hypothetical protein